MSFLSENEIEDWACDILRECGYTIVWGPEIAPGGKKPERTSLSDVILEKRLRAAIDRLNPHLPQRGNLTEGLYIGLDYEKVCFVEKKFP